MADEGGGYAGEGKEVVGPAFMTAMEASVAGRPGHGPDHPLVSAEPLRGLDALASDVVPADSPS